MDLRNGGADRYRLILESATSFAILATDRDGIIVEWNPGAEAIFGWSAEEMIGQPTERIFTPEDQMQDRPTAEMETARRDGRALDDRWHVRKDGTRFWASGEMMPLRGDDGEHLGFLKILRDRTQEHKSGQELASTKARFEHERGQMARMFEQAPSFMAMVQGPQHRFELVNPGYMRLIGHRDVLGKTVAEALPDAAAQGYVELLDHVFSSGEAHTSRDALYAVQVEPGGPVVERYVDFVFQPIRDALGKVTSIFVEGTDVTDRVQAALALRQTESRYRALIENVDVGICIIEMIFDENGRPMDYLFLEANPALEREAGMVEPVGRRMREFAPHHEQHWFDTYGRVAVTGEPAHFENYAEGLGGRWFDVHAIRVGEHSERRVAVLFSDITERKRMEEQRAVLNAELAHRLKNTLATVQSIATQTLRSAPDTTTARKSLTERIQALANAHDLLLRGTREAGSIEDIVRGAVSVHDGENRISLSGPNLTVGPTAALSLSLVCHELATNAGKYGALSAPAGQVLIAWQVEAARGGEPPLLVFEWIERGGPPVIQPEHTSFVTRLIGMGLSGGGGASSEIHYDHEGLRCRIVAPLQELQEEPSEG